MPLTSHGRKTLKRFKKKYKKDGEGIFYAWLNLKSKAERRKFEKIE